MGEYEPPADCPGQPVIEELPAGTRLYRIHRDAPFAANAMNSTPQPELDCGGRFDSLDGSYAYTYVGASVSAAIGETLCRDLPLESDNRLIAIPRLHGMVLSGLLVTRNLLMVALHGPYLTRVGQDTWLTKCLPRDYLLTRRWAAAIRGWVPDADGFAYRCRHNEDEIAWVLFGLPHVAAHPCLALVSNAAIRLDSPTGLTLLRSELLKYKAGIART